MIDEEESEHYEMLPPLPSKHNLVSQSTQDARTKRHSRRHTNPFLLPIYEPTEQLPEEDTTDVEDDGQRDGQKMPSVKKEDRKFRKIAQMIANQYKWTKPSRWDSQVGSDKTSDVEERPTFNVEAFCAHVQSIGKLTDNLKTKMRKIHWERSPEDVEEVYFLVNKLKCFDNYPEHVKREISKVLYYDVYEDGRILFKQGHPGMSFYFILSGGVTIIREELDTVTHQTHQQVVDEKAAGDTFGEIALLQNTTRTSTVICKGDSEFFRVDRPDFDQVLRKSHQLDREETLNCLSTQKMFQEWNLEQLKFANAYTKLVSFPPNTVIFNDLKESPEFVHLILSGQCKVVREVTMVKTVFPFGQTRLTLAPLDAVSSTKLEKNQYLDSHFFVVCILQTGQYFGVGEDLCKTCILSGGNKVTCLLVNRIVFNRPENKHFLETMKTHLTETVPSRLAAYKCFLADRRWKVYKKKTDR